MFKISFYFIFLTMNCLNYLWGSEVSIPEPMVFDLVRGLGAQKGEMEINTLMHQSFKSHNKKPNRDPFGTGATTYDHQKIEWAPEIEYVLADGFAVEFEAPFEGKYFEAYKIAAQYTFGTPYKNYIHGLQLIIEPTVEFENYNTTLLYIGGYRFNDTLSTLFMVGGRTHLEGEHKHSSLEYITNATLFVDITHSLVFGLENNYSRKVNNGRYAFNVIPQIQYELNKNIELQTGLSFGESTYGSEIAIILRAIYCF